MAVSRAAFWALLLRDLAVLRKNLSEFVLRTLVQPFLLVFVFLYVFPQIGQGVGGGAGGESSFATVLVAGVVGLSIMFQGIQAVALPLANEFGYTKEIEDRVLAPLPVAMVAVGKVLAGALQGLIAAAIVFPIAYCRACQGRGSPSYGALGDSAHPHPAGLHHVLQLRAGAGNAHSAAPHQRHVRFHRPADNLLGRYLL